jgi:hypothetical protein
MFEILDKMMQVVNKDPKIYRAAFSMNRPSMIIPYDVSNYNDVLPPSGELEDGTPYIVESMGFDTIRVSLLDHDFVKFECADDDQRKILNAWLLRRIEKVLNLGWEEYCNQYVA